MLTGDVLIRRQVAIDRKGLTREFFTLHEFPSGRFIEGPIESEVTARARGLSRDGRGDVYLETAPGSGTYALISP